MGEEVLPLYVSPGYRDNRHNAARLKSFQYISQRVAEIQGNAARATEVSIQSTLRELDDAIGRAGTPRRRDGQCRVATGKALWLDGRTATDRDHANSYDDATCAEEILTDIAERVGVEAAVSRSPD